MSSDLIEGRYRLDQRVGAGGMGTVWRATDTRLERTVAVKVLNEAIQHDPAMAERLRREARIAATVDHPNIARVYGFVEGPPPAIVMEFIEGHTLADRLGAGALPLDDALSIADQVLAALAAAHAAGVVHRDVKPGNILLSYQGDVKVADLGIARATGDQTVTSTGAVLGSIHYCAPERLRGEATTPASDVYGVGAVLYEMLTGRRPFDGETPAAVMAAHLEGRAEPLRRIDPSIPGPLEAIVMRALDASVARRFADAGAMRDALSARAEAGHTDVLAVDHDEPTTILAAPPEPATPSKLEPVAAAVPPRWVRRRLVPWLAPALVAAAIASVIVLSGGGGVAQVPTPTATPPSSASPSPTRPSDLEPDVGQAIAGLLATIVNGADNGAIAEGLDDELLKDVDEVRRAARDGDREKALAEVEELRDEIETAWDEGTITGRSVIRRLRAGVDELRAAVEREVRSEEPAVVEEGDEEDHPGQGRGPKKKKRDD